jgi:hypothetical protein
MKPQHAPLFLRWLPAAALLTLGCVTARAPVRPVETIEEASREHVYCFVVNGLDPKECGNLPGLADHLRCLGFRNTCYGQVYHWGELLNQVCQVWKEDPEAKIVLVGFSCGAYSVRDIARELNARNIPVALMVYLAADLFRDTPDVWPPNVARIVHIYGDGFFSTADTCWFRGTNISRARNIHLNTPHIAIPKHPETIAAVTEEVLALSAVDW